MLLNNCDLDILIYISKYLSIAKLRNFILHGKYTYTNKYAFLKSNPYLDKYLRFDNTTALYHIIFLFDDKLPHLTHCDRNRNSDSNSDNNRKELYAITNIVSYSVANDVLSKNVAENHLLTMYASAYHDNFDSKRIYKNARLKLCCKIFKHIFQYDWEYLNISIFDLFDIIHAIVYKNYNDLYIILYHLKIHKALSPLKTIHILLNYKGTLDNIATVGNTQEIILSYGLIYILYNYIEHIYQYIIETDFKKLIPMIIERSVEIKSSIRDNSRLPNNLKILFLKKINNVYDLFYTVSSYS